MKKKISLLLVLLTLLSVLLACQKQEPKEKTIINIGVLKGPTGIGASYLLEQNSNEKTENVYKPTIVAEATEMVSHVAAGEVDIAAVPTNVAAALYNKTNGGVKLLALNTAGVLYILENGNSINSIEDLKGKTIYTVGQGANPEYVLRYILSQNSLTVGEDVQLEFLDSAELTTKAASGDVDVCMLPVPAATTVLIKNQNMRSALDLTAEWEKLNNGSALTMGCVVVRSDFYENNKEAVQTFLKEYEESIKYVIDNPATAGELCEKHEIVPAAAVATKAIPDANLIFVSGEEVKNMIKGYYQVLFEADPKSIGGKLPQDDFYITE